MKTSLFDVPIFHRIMLYLLLAGGAVMGGIILLLAGAGGPEAESQKGAFASQPTWSQNFATMPNGPIDPAVWNYELDPEVPGYQNEAQAYTSNTDNVRIEAGKLIIQANRQRHVYSNDPTKRLYEITSGRIDTRNSLTFEYGKLEARIKLPQGSGTWPAFWLLSDNQPFSSRLHPTEQDWQQERFYLHDGEIDIMEAYGDEPGTIEATLHSFKKTHAGRTQIPDATSTYHKYGVEITPNSLIWTIDGEPFYSRSKSTADTDEWPVGKGNRFYAIFNLAMGGTSGGKIDPAVSNWQLDIQAVNFYAYSEPKND